ncbi:DNA-directed RNA polymerase subunit beta [Streptococcus infantis]|nr:DNA-directed RNA polymerase subunit beta [Streptococcus infantis]
MDSRTDEALKEIYERLRPGEPKTAESSRTLLVARFFDPRRYDLAAVGRYKINKKLNNKTRLLNQQSLNHWWTLKLVKSWLKKVLL